MARRQGGIHFSYLVVAIVMCVGLIFWIVIQNGKLSDVAGDRDAKVKAAAQKDDTIRDLSTRYDRLRMVTIGTDTKEPDIAELTALLAQASDDVANALGNQQGGQNYSGLQALYTDTVQALNTHTALLDSQKSAARSKEDEAVAAVQAREAIVASLNEQIATLRDESGQLQVTLERVRTEAREESGRLRDELQTVEEEWSSRVYQLQRELAISKGLHDQSIARIEVLEYELKKEETFAMVEPDGKVLRVEEELGFAWIDLGREHRVRRGLIFDVFQYVKGGKRLKKGRVEVAKIEADWAEVRIIDTYDRFNPIAAGDQIASPFYSGDDAPVFVFAGEKPVNRRLSREEMVRKIEAFGGSVEEAVRLETNYVIAIQGYEETPEYKEARKLGITILREEELLDFIEQ